MKSSFLLTPLLLLAAGIAVFAQPPSPSGETPSPEALPKPPLMADAGAKAEWTVNYTPKNSGKESNTPEAIRNRKMRQQYSPLVLEKRILKGDGQMVIYTTYEAGLKSESWVVGNYVYELPIREGEGIRIDPKPASDFPEIDWISAANFRGAVKQKKHKVYLYETDLPDQRQTPVPTPAEGSAAPVALKASHRRAYIDTATRLPVMAETDTSTWTYHYFEAPSALPVMDERIAKQLKSATE